MIPIADGSDMGGSLRNPASFCNVVGFRPSPGRVPVWPADQPWSTLAVEGPMARTVADVALLLSVMAGPDPRAPIAIVEPGAKFAGPLARDFKNVRVAWLTDLDGAQFDPRVRSVVDGRRASFEQLGCVVTEGNPDFSGVDAIFQTLRAWGFAAGHAAHLRDHRALLKDTVIWNTEAGLALSGRQVSQAESARGALYHRVREFMLGYEFMVLPTVQVPPFDVNLPYVREINGVPLHTYVDWMKSCYAITMTGLPAISVPAGFTAEGLPVGLQIVGRHQDDLGVLRLAHAFEQTERIAPPR